MIASRLLSLFLLLLALLGLAGCSTTSVRSASSNTPTSLSASDRSALSQLAGQYEAVDRPVAVEEKEFLARMSLPAAGQTTTSAPGELARELAPLVVGLQTYQETVLSLKWPPSILPAARALVRRVGSLIGTLQVVEMQSSSSSGILASEISASARAVSREANIVRHDLGLASSASV